MQNVRVSFFRYFTPILGTLTVFAGVGAPEHARADAACVAALAEKIAAKNERLGAEYRGLDSERGGLKKDNGGRLLIGTSDRAVLVLHGFAASPFEVMSLGRELHRAGATVYLPVLPGFGSSAKVANQYDSSDWRNEVVEDVNLLGDCFSEIALAGFSTGGSLVTDFLLTDPKLAKNGIYDGRFRIRSAAIFSPYYRSNAGAMDWLDSILVGTNLTQEIRVSTLYRFSRNRDLRAPLAYPVYYNAEFPLIAAAQVVELGKKIEGIGPDRKSAVPLWVAYSESDRTIKTEIIPPFIAGHFPDAKTFVIPKQAKIPHQILVLDDKNDGKKMLKEAISHLLSR